MKKIIGLVLFVMLLVNSNSMVYANEIKENREYFFIEDTADILDEKLEKAIYKDANKLYEEYQVQVLLLTSSEKLESYDEMLNDAYENKKIDNTDKCVVFILEKSNDVIIHYKIGKSVTDCLNEEVIKKALYDDFRETLINSGYSNAIYKFCQKINSTLAMYYENNKTEEVVESDDTSINFVIDEVGILDDFKKAYVYLHLEYLYKVSAIYDFTEIYPMFIITNKDLTEEEALLYHNYNGNKKYVIFAFNAHDNRISIYSEDEKILTLEQQKEIIETNYTLHQKGNSDGAIIMEISSLAENFIMDNFFEELSSKEVTEEEVEKIEEPQGYNYQIIINVVVAIVIVFLVIMIIIEKRKNKSSKL